MHPSSICHSTTCKCIDQHRHDETLKKRKHWLMDWFSWKLGIPSSAPPSSPAIWLESHLGEVSRRSFRRRTEPRAHFESLDWRHPGKPGIRWSLESLHAPTFYPPTFLLNPWLILAPAGYDLQPSIFWEVTIPALIGMDLAGKAGWKIERAGVARPIC